MNQSWHLTKVIAAKNDEFYTRPATVSAGLAGYEHAFQGRRVVCPCNNGPDSAFVQHVLAHWDELNPSRLIAVTRNEWGGLFGGHGLKYEWTAPGEPTVTELDGDGDFRSIEVNQLFTPGALVFDNPPFSLGADFTRQTIQHDCDMLCLNTTNLAGVNKVFPLIQTGRLRLGIKPEGEALLFRIPDETPASSNDKPTSSGRLRRIGQLRWYTTFTDAKPLPLPGGREWAGHETEWEQYDGTNIIECPTIKDIPLDYDGLMGVPLTFLDHHNRYEYEIIGKIKPTINGRGVFIRLIIQRRR